jgi:hypothetical protein
VVKKLPIAEYSVVKNPSSYFDAATKFAISKLALRLASTLASLGSLLAQEFDLSVACHPSICTQGGPEPAEGP